MGELADAWSAARRPNVWGDVPRVVEMQSEGGAAGAVHGALQAGALATTFTASQGLLLMIPNMYKIAGELTPFCMHVAARTLATHALSIFGDHSDVMACRQTGFAMLALGSVQEAHDLAASPTPRRCAPACRSSTSSTASAPRTRWPTIEALTDDDLRALVDDGAVRAHRARALTPDRPVLRGTAQNPDAFFQAREAAQRLLRRRARQSCRRRWTASRSSPAAHYRLFDYARPPRGRARAGADGLGRRDGAGDGRLAGRPRRARRRR